MITSPLNERAMIKTLDMSSATTFIYMETMINITIFILVMIRRRIGADLGGNGSRLGEDMEGKGNMILQIS